MHTCLDPAPHSGKERGRVDHRDRAERLRVVGSRECGCLLEVLPPVPERAQGDVLEIDDGCDRGYWRWGGGVGEEAAQRENEAGHHLIQSNSNRW